MKNLFMAFMLIIVISFVGCNGGSSNDNLNISTNGSSNTVDLNNLPKKFLPGKFGEIELTKDFVIPKDALFIDIRNPFEILAWHAPKSVGGAIFEYRPSKVINDHFVDDVLRLANGDRDKYIILICNSSSRSKKAAQWLSTPQDQKWRGFNGGGFTRVYHVLGGMEKWEELGLNIISEGDN